MKKLNWRTLSVFLGLLGILLGYDVWTLSRNGYSATVSWNLLEWSKEWPAIPFVFGFFCGHLFFPNRGAGPAP